MDSYRAVLIGSSATLEGLSFFEPQEASTPEGSLMLLELHLTETPSQSVVDEINLKCANSGVIPWPNSVNIASVDPYNSILVLRWVKAIAWMSVIIGILVLMVLPTLLGGLIWWLMPDWVKQMIEAMVMMGIMMLMMRMIMPMITEKKKPKEITE